MTTINNLGDNLAVVLSKSNNFSTEGLSNLNPPIEQQEYFRILSNNVVEIYCSFTANTATINEDGTLTESKLIIAGLKDVWYKCKDRSITTPIIYLTSPDPSIYNSIDMVFQFVKQVPSDYLYYI